MLLSHSEEIACTNFAEWNSTDSVQFLMVSRYDYEVWFWFQRKFGLLFSFVPKISFPAASGTLKGKGHPIESVQDDISQLPQAGPITNPILGAWEMSVQSQIHLWVFFSPQHN